MMSSPMSRLKFRLKPRTPVNVPQLFGGGVGARRQAASSSSEATAAPITSKMSSKLSSGVKPSSAGDSHPTSAGRLPQTGTSSGEATCTVSSSDGSSVMEDSKRQSSIVSRSTWARWMPSNRASASLLSEAEVVIVAVARKEKAVTVAAVPRVHGGGHADDNDGGVSHCDVWPFLMILVQV